MILGTASYLLGSAEPLVYDSVIWTNLNSHPITAQTVQEVA